jgi:hypothetical protein
MFRRAIKSLFTRIFASVWTPLVNFTLEEQKFLTHFAPAARKSNTSTGYKTL